MMPFLNSPLNTANETITNKVESDIEKQALQKSIHPVLGGAVLKGFINVHYTHSHTLLYV